MDWFQVDKKGLGKLLERRGKKFIVSELLQNAWDEKSTHVKVEFSPVEGTYQYELTVEDDNPEGFVNLAHAFTLFAESNKKGNAEQRGRFNLGEKLVLAISSEAEIRTTKGHVYFDEDGRHTGRSPTTTGSIVRCRIKATRAEYEEICNHITTLIPPDNIVTTFNGVPLEHRPRIACAEVTLPTECADAEGVLRRTNRKTSIHIYAPVGDEKATIYEMGIPVVELDGDKYHVDVQQKIPLSFERDNISPAYLRDIRTAVLNATYDLLDAEEASATWVKEACQDEDVEQEAVKEVIKKRFGDKVVAYDPSDPESNKIAVANGYTVLAGRTLSANEWENVKKASIVLPAGRVTPSPKPYRENGNPLNTIPLKDYTDGMKAVDKYARKIAEIALNGKQISVVMVAEFGWPFSATYGKDGILTLNKTRLGNRFFDNFYNSHNEVLCLLIHEFAHEYASDHLSSQFYDACCLIGARIALSYKA